MSISANYASLLPDMDSVWAQIMAHAVPEGDCMLSTYSSVKRTGYSQVRYNGRKYYVHVVAAMRRAGRAPRPDDEASHLCNNPRCVRPEHLVLESGPINKSRQCCKLYGSEKGYKCPHSPTCLGCVELS